MNFCEPTPERIDIARGNRGWGEVTPATMLRASLRATPAVAGVAGVSAVWWFEHNYEEVSTGPAPRYEQTHERTNTHRHQHHHHRHHHPSVDDTSKPEVLVVGSGVVGVSTAYMIARQGYRVTVLEKQKEICGELASSTGNAATLGVSTVTAPLAR